MQHSGEHETSTADDDLESQDGHTAPSEAHTTPVTTALSTASRRFPSDLKTIPCTWPNCTKTFNRPARLTAHLRSHTNDRPFKCPDCPKTYLEEKHLRQHIKGSHSQERQYVCDECDKAFLTATRLRRHAAVHEGQDRFRCRGYDDNCTRTFRKHQTLQRHIRVDHLNQPAFACTHEITSPCVGGAAGDKKPCDAVFESTGALRRHIERDHTAPKFWCDECGKARAAGGEGNSGGIGFATRALLEAHMRHAHVDCPFCDIRFTGPAELHKHIDMHHSGKSVADRKTIVCPHAGCGKTFTRRANLNVHIRAVHEGLRFVCGDGADAASTTTAEGAGVDRKPSNGWADPELVAWEARGEGCGRGFVSKMKLEEHIRYVHLRRERPVPVFILDPEAAAATATFTNSTPTFSSGLATPAPAQMLMNGAGGSDDLATPSADMLIDALLGTNRTLVCTLPGCTARFVRHHDLSVHLQRDHATVEEAPENNDNDNDNLFNPDEFWIGGGDHMDDDAAAAAAAGALVAGDDDIFGTYMGMDNIDMGLAVNGNSNNIMLPPQAMVDNSDPQWQMDEAEMRRLIGSDDANDGGSGGGGSGSAIMNFLDPNLFL